MTLPPLPKPHKAAEYSHDAHVFSAFDVQEYGRLCAEAEREALARAFSGVEFVNEQGVCCDVADAIRARSQR